MRVYRDRLTSAGELTTPADKAMTVAISAELDEAVAFAKAAHVVRLETKIQRVTGVPMEPRACVAWFEPDTGRYTVHAGSGGIVRQKREIATILGVAFDKVRVTADDIGGNFGTPLAGHFKQLKAQRTAGTQRRMVHPGQQRPQQTL